MVNLVTTAVDTLAESATEITSDISKNVPIIGNAAICADSLCTTGRAGINFYYSPNPVAKVFFGASCLCGVMGAASSGTALLTSFAAAQNVQLGILKELLTSHKMDKSQEQDKLRTLELVIITH